MTSARRLLAALAVVAAGHVTACGSDSETPCSVPADCASGICQADGTCAPLADTADARPDALFDDLGVLDPDTGGADTATAADTGTASDSDTDTAADTAADTDTDTGGSVVCAPNGDGVVERREMPLAAGLHATYAIATDVDFDTHAVVAANGANTWDLSSFPGDQRTLVEALDPADFWFGDSFADATYATRLATDSDLLGVFRVDADGLWLLGVVSPAGGFTRTELSYSPPAKLLAFPLSVGAHWESTSTVTGVTSGVATFASESYTGDVDAAGVVTTPFADFPVLRAIVQLDRLVGAALYYDVQQLYVAECFGTVASVRSGPYESGPELDAAAEIRRLAP
ncbi:MAG: hypothetical protein H6745_19640 [Deltaproteobacteria bacterium]|nr:hypothetical protein [Deltaproteobacteria bacterium]